MSDKRKPSKSFVKIKFSSIVKSKSLFNNPDDFWIKKKNLASKEFFLIFNEIAFVVYPGWKVSNLIGSVAKGCPPPNTPEKFSDPFISYYKWLFWYFPNPSLWRIYVLPWPWLWNITKSRNWGGRSNGEPKNFRLFGSRSDLDCFQPCFQPLKVFIDWGPFKS